MGKKKAAKKTATKKAEKKAVIKKGTKKNLDSRPIPKLYKTPESKWSELTFGHSKKVSSEFLSEFEICEGFPDTEGNFLFFYGAEGELIGWANNDAKHKKKLQSIAKLIEHLEIGTLCGDKGRNRASWAIFLNCMEDGKCNSYCQLFIELREVKPASLVSYGGYTGTLKTTLELHLQYLNGNGGEPCSAPNSLWSAENYLKEFDPKKKLKVREIKKEMDQKEREIERELRKKKEDLAKWFIQSCIDQL